MTAIKTISSEELKQRDLQDGIILDVRSGMEHDEQRLTCPHAHVPLDWLNPAQFMQQQGKSVETPVYILCRSGGRATKAAEKFTAAGYENVYVITGGIVACAADGHATEGAQKATADDGHVAGTAPAAHQVPRLAPIRWPLDIERQVRAIAGALVVLGAFLGMTSSGFFTFLTMLVGGALAYSGLTGDSRLALLLAKAPWNKGAGGTCMTGQCGTENKSATEEKKAA